MPPLKNSAFPPFTLLYTCTVRSSTSQNVRVLTADVTKRVFISTGYLDVLAAVLKDSLTLGAAAHFTPGAHSWQLTVSASVLTEALQATLSVAFACNAMTEIEFSTQVICSNSGNAKIFKVDLMTGTANPASSIAVTGPYNNYNFEIASQSAYFIGYSSNWLPILARSNFATIKIPSTTATTWFYTLDNLNDSLVMGFTAASPASHIRHFNTQTWVNDGSTIHANIDISSVGTRNNILNFGPYQYVVTIPESASPAKIVVVSKLLFLVTSTFPVASLAASTNLPHVGTMAWIGDTFPLVVHHNVNKSRLA